MASRDTEFAAFVDARGPALMRTASLLELDGAVAEAALVASLASVARQWRAFSRDGNAEAEVRHRLPERLAAQWRRDGSLHDVPRASLLSDDSAGARQALAALSNSDRALVVLTAYESLTAPDAGLMLGLRATDADTALGSATSRFRQIAGVAPDAPLLPLLNAAASRDVPPDLADRALGASRSGHRRILLRVAAAGVAAVALAAVVVTVLPESESASTTETVSANIERWGIPGEPRIERRLPTLVEQPIEAASMAFVTKGRPFVTDAATGAVRNVLPDKPQPQWYDGDVNGVVTGLLRRGPPWSQAVLSPDGEWLLLVQATNGTKRPGATGVLYLVRVDTGAVTPVPDAEPVARPWGEVSIADSVLAWAPGGGAFACVCDGTLSVFDLEPTAPRVRPTTESSMRVTDVAWGGAGLIARRVDGDWVPVSTGESYLPGLGKPDALAMSLASSPVYLTVNITSIFALGADTEPDGGSCLRWDDSFTDPVPVTPVPDRDGNLCTPVALQPGRSGVLLAVRPISPRPPPPLDVVVVDTFGASTAIATLPPGTTYASFAGTLVG